MACKAYIHVPRTGSSRIRDEPAMARSASRTAQPHPERQPGQQHWTNIDVPVSQAQLRFLYTASSALSNAKMTMFYAAVRELISSENNTSAATTPQGYSSECFIGSKRHHLQPPYSSTYRHAHARTHAYAGDSIRSAPTPDTWGRAPEPGESLPRRPHACIGARGDAHQHRMFFMDKTFTFASVLR